MDTTAIEYGSPVVEAVDPLLLAAIEWANAKPEDRLDPQWFYAFGDLLRTLEAYRLGVGR